MSHVALGVSGGIGAYKAVEVARGLQQHGHDVTAVMTRHARRFVGPLTFEAITRRKVVTDQFAPGTNADIEHIALASGIGLLVVAPATANVLAKFAHGLADDFLSALHLATRAPVLLAPAMNSQMWEHPAVRTNLELLQGRGVHVIGPGAGYLACGWVGKGRLAEPDEIVARAHAILTGGAELAGKRLVISAGPTYEDFDPVRYIGNRSSGRMGLALAEEAARQGAEVILVLGPSGLEPPPGVRVVHVRSAADMHRAVMAEYGAADAIIMAAAVADYTPDAVRGEKIPKEPGDLVLRLVRTRDILADLGARRAASPAAGRPVLVGFAAETHEVLEKARAKRRLKQVDLILANDVSRPDTGFEVDTNAGVIIGETDEEALPLQSKHEMAKALLARVRRLLESARPSLESR